MNSNKKESAKKNLLHLINVCVMKGGIFNDAQAVAEMVNSVHVLGADDIPAANGSMMPLKASASEQLQNRIDNEQA